MNNAFDAVYVKNPDRNHFDLSHANKLTLALGRLTPILVEEVVPGDVMRCSEEHLIRLAPMVAPMMQRMNVSTHFFYVPNRILWDDWEEWIISGGVGSGMPQFPFYKLPDQVNPNDLLDYLGIPMGNYASSSEVNNTNVNAFPIAAFIKIWQDYYGDQNLQDITQFEGLVAGDNTMMIDQFLADWNGLPPRRAWTADRFTTALPWLQKGNPVALPLGTTATVMYDDSQVGEEFASRLRNPAIAGHPPSTTGDIGATTIPTTSDTGGEIGGSDEFFTVDNTGTLIVDLSNASAATINDLREAFAVQRYLELNARAGTRYTEFLRAHFGVRSSDARLQRAEYLGGGKSPVVISEVLQTSATTDFEGVQQPQGNMSGHGINIGKSYQFDRSFEEHGFIIGIMSVLPEVGYFGGLRRHWRKLNDALDYLTPLLAQIGEQPIYNYELMYDGTQWGHDVFGYEPRYGEYRSAPSEVHGDFVTTMGFWHMDRNFDDTVALNEEFITCNPRQDGFAVTDMPVVFAHLWFNFHAWRKLPKYNIPAIE